MQSGALPNLFESALYCIKGVWSLTTNVYLYFSACKLRSKGKGDRREPIPPVSQVPPVGEIDTFLHQKSGCKKASTYGKNNFASGCGGQKSKTLPNVFESAPSAEKGKGERSDAEAEWSEANPSRFQVPPVGEIDAFFHHRSGCKKASTCGKTHFAFGCGGQRCGYDIKILTFYNNVNVFGSRQGLLKVTKGN